MWGWELRSRHAGVSPEDFNVDKSDLVATFQARPGIRGGSHVADLYFVCELVGALPELLDEIERLWAERGKEVVMSDDNFEQTESEHEVVDADGAKKRFHVSHINVGKPRDDQERAGLILARAQRVIMGIRDKYMLMRSQEVAQAAAEGREVPSSDYRELTFASMIMCTDLAHRWMSCPRSAFEDDEGNLVMHHYKLDGSIAHDGEVGIMLGDYVKILGRLYAICKNEAVFGPPGADAFPSRQYFSDAIWRLPEDLDHDQAEYERCNFHMDIGCSIRSGDMGQDNTQPTYHEDDLAVPEGGGPIDPEPFKNYKPPKKRRLAKKLKNSKKRRTHR